MTDKELLRLIGTTQPQDIMKALETREKGITVMKRNDDRGTKPGKYVKKGRKITLIAAAVTVSLLVGGVVAANHYRHGLVDKITVNGLQDPEGYEDLLVTAPQTEAPQDPSAEPELQPLVSGRDDTAEYQILEAILDSESLYIHGCIKPLQEDVMLIDEWVDPDSPLDFLQNPEITGEGTVEEYAKSQGKRLVRARLKENFNGASINGWGIRCETQADGSMHLYGEGSNPTGEGMLSVTFEGFTYEVGESGPFLDRTALELTLEDQSSADEVVYTQFQAYDPDSPDLEKDLGYVIDSLTMKKTELGIYATFVYRPTEELKQRIEDEIVEAQSVEYEEGEKDENGFPMDLICSPEYIRDVHLIRFIMLDENGEYFQVAGPAGGDPGIVDNGDGTYSCTYPMAPMESTDNLKFRVLTGDLNKVGTYEFSR